MRCNNNKSKKKDAQTIPILILRTDIMAEDNVPGIPIIEFLPRVTMIMYITITSTFANAPGSCTTTTASLSVVTMTTHVEDEVSAVAHVHLPSFWQHSPRQWFKHAEAVLHNNRVHSDLSKINHVLVSLNEDGFRTIFNLLRGLTSYNTIRDRLINVYNVPPVK